VARVNGLKGREWNIMWIKTAEEENKRLQRRSQLKLVSECLYRSEKEEVRVRERKMKIATIFTKLWSRCDDREEKPVCTLEKLISFRTFEYKKLFFKIKD
jgi:hypothetical protein